VRHVIVGHAFPVAQTHQGHVLGAVQGLDLAFLIHAEHHGLVGRVEIEPDDVPNLLHKEWIGGELEMALARGLKAESSPDAMDRGSEQVRFVCPGADAPVGAVSRFGHERLADQVGHLLIRDGARPSGSEFIAPAGQALLRIALAPLAHGLGAESQSLRNRGGAGPLRGHQHQARLGPPGREAGRANWRRPSTEGLPLQRAGRGAWACQWPWVNSCL
jgi:hypothetical protein